MHKFIFSLLFFASCCNSILCQDVAPIFTNVDTLFMPAAAPGNLLANDPMVTPIVSSSPCNLPQRHFAMASEYQSGRVVAIGHESLLSDGSIMEYDNLDFVTNAIDWLGTGSGTVSLKAGWVNGGNTAILESTLVADNYSFNTLATITTASLTNTDVLILGNDWNGTQPYSAMELLAIDAFVAGGGGLFIAGLGWSWPEVLSDYPMNQVANLFGFEYATAVINDAAANINGSPKLYNFFPENVNTIGTPYCPSPFVGVNLERGDTMRVLRLAVSTTGEFTQQSGGVAATAELLGPWLEEINAIYGREYCVRFELIENNDLLIFADPVTDPWGTLPPGSGGCTNAGIILNEQFNVFNTVIGSANYDISHVIAGSPFGGGCAGSLQTGVSGGLNIPVTRHEMGHQLAQSHTINHTDNSNYETENGAWTIQGGNAQGHAHGASYHQLAAFLNNIPATGTKVATGNTIPSVDAGADVVIPFSTPFTLRGIVNDPDSDANLTYVWDNMNRGIGQSIPVADDSQGALFMRLLPDANSTRTFPRMSDVLANNNANEQEQLPTQARIMDIRLTVNDNHRMMYNGELINASATNSDDIQITVADTGPFVVTSQDTVGIHYWTGQEIEVTWQVNGTDIPPVNTQNVDIHLSVDGGLTYPILLSGSTPNDGAALVFLPIFEPAEAARVRVSAVDNIYFDVNTQDFLIEQNISSTNELNGATVAIYPNPAKDYFQIDFSAPLKYQVEVYDAQGRLLIQTSNKDRFDVSAFSEGIYLIVVTDLDSYEKVTKRMVVGR